MLQLTSKLLRSLTLILLVSGIQLALSQDAETTTVETFSTVTPESEVAEILLETLNRTFKNNDESSPDTESSESGSSGSETGSSASETGSSTSETSPTTAKPSNIFRVPGRKYPVAARADGSPQSTPEFLRNDIALRGWISDELGEALWAFAPSPKKNMRCSLHSQLYRKSLQNYTLWAMHMLESSTRVASGLTSSSIYQLGHFDECIDIELKGEQLDGKYCLATIHFAPDEKLYPAYHQPDTSPKFKGLGPYDNAYDVFKSMFVLPVLESSTRVASGLTSSSIYQLGHFDECIDIELKGEQLDGKYCLATIHFAPDEKLYPAYHQPDTSPKFKGLGPYDNAYDVFKPSPDLSRRRRDKVFWSVCVPSSCTAADVLESMNALVKDNLAQHGLQVNISLPNEMCYARREDPPFSLGFFIVLAVLGVLFLIVVHATWMDMFYYQSGREHSKKWRKFLKPFSAYTNMTKLITANPDREFSEFHYCKLFAMACVISGHRQMFLHGPTPSENPGWLEWTYSYFLVAFSVNGGVLVDVFFFLSGFLTCHYIYMELEKRKRLNLVAIIINRWIRIVPVYMFVIAVYAWVLPYTGDGPLWKARIGVESERCVNNWWVNLLFINNYINPEQQCMVQAWYLACDMHFFIVGSLIVYAAWKWKGAGNLIMWGSLAIACIIPGYVTYKNNYWGVILHYNSLFVDPVKTEHFISMYMPSHTRFGPYVVGMIGAYTMTKLKEKEYKFSLPVIIIGSMIGAFLSAGTLVSGYLFYIRDRPYDLWENVLYGALHRSVWSAGIVWFFVVEISPDMHPFLTAFGRLTYCAYLVHVLPQLIQTSTTRLPEYVDMKRMVWYSMGDFTYAYIFALFLNLLFEAPLERVQKKVLKRMVRNADAKLPKKGEVNMNGNELTEVKETTGIDNHAMDKTDITN
ncbi:nose resistant to fluoxetine protein 6 [Nilaparvata lugens]|uniref:nose resistant to fluoxetine protein 6 n=1 Tax=Nilaparvata lugens TaxID=108931 RepID=UPI00193D6AC7|nr:nose resistant to fluoxetine protein 6 [Nilaparvata lugens]